MKKRLLTMLLSFCLALPLFVACADVPAGAVEVNFGVKDGLAVQNLKKFDNFTSTWAWVGTQTGTTDPNTLKMVPALSEIKAENLRFDLFMGYTGLGYEIGRGPDKNATTDAEFAQTMQLVDKLTENNVVPYVEYFAAPEYCGANWKKVDDYEKWEELCRNIAAYFKAKDIRLAAHEVWNEPDFNGSFFSGDWVDYIDTYIAATKGIRSANPDAVVVGMSAALIQELCNDKTTVKEDGEKTAFQRFIERTYDEYMPDAVSWHYYGREGQISGRADEYENFSSYLGAIRSSLQGYQDGTHADLAEGVSYPKLETMQQHLNEFNIFQPSVDAIYQTVEMLPGMFYAFDELLAATDVTRVSWAALVGEKNGKLSYDLIDGQSYQRYPAYHALWMYAHLPVDRVAVDLGNENLGTMAGVDAHRAGLIVYNKSGVEQEVSVKLTGLPFEKGNLDVYLVDDEHYSYTTQNAPLLVRQRENITADGTEVRMTLKPNAAYYVEMNDVSGKSDTDELVRLGKIVRRDYWYPERGDNLPYADPHENSMTAHVGMVNNAEGKSAMSVTLDGMQQYGGMKVNYETWGNPVRSDGSVIGLRVDYRKQDGSWQAGNLYTVGDFNFDLVTPFGSKSAAKGVVSMGGMNGQYEISFADAPADWDGRIAVTYMIKDAGAGATAKFILREGTKQA